VKKRSILKDIWLSQWDQLFRDAHSANVSSIRNVAKTENSIPTNNTKKFGEEISREWHRKMDMSSLKRSNFARI